MFKKSVLLSSDAKLANVCEKIKYISASWRDSKEERAILGRNSKGKGNSANDSVFVPGSFWCYLAVLCQPCLWDQLFWGWKPLQALGAAHAPHSHPNPTRCPSAVLTKCTGSKHLRLLSLQDTLHLGSLCSPASIHLAGPRCPASSCRCASLLTAQDFAPYVTARSVHVSNPFLSRVSLMIPII